MGRDVAVNYCSFSRSLLQEHTCVRESQLLYRRVCGLWMPTLIERAEKEGRKIRMWAASERGNHTHT